MPTKIPRLFRPVPLPSDEPYNQKRTVPSKLKTPLGTIKPTFDKQIAGVTTRTFLASPYRKTSFLEETSWNGSIV